MIEEKGTIVLCQPINPDLVGDAQYTARTQYEAQQRIGLTIAELLMENEGDQFAVRLTKRVDDRPFYQTEPYFKNPHRKDVHYFIEVSPVYYEPAVFPQYTVPPTPRPKTQGELSYTPIRQMITAVWQRSPFYWRNVERDVMKARKEL